MRITVRFGSRRWHAGWGSAAAALLLIGMDLTAAMAGEFGSRSIRRSMGWEPSYCTKPYEPSFYVTDVDDFNRAVGVFNRYVQDMKSYVACVGSEADEDSRTTSRAIEEGRDEAIDEAVGEVDSLRSRLELQRP